LKWITSMPNTERLIVVAKFPKNSDSSHGARLGGNLHTKATHTSAGFMSSADKIKLDSITGNPTSIVGITGTKAEFDAAATDGNFMWVGDAPTAHTHTASEVTDFSEAVDDRVSTLLVAGSNVTLTYNDGANTLTVASTGGAGSSNPLMGWFI
jgi:hypothetical protein